MKKLTAIIFCFVLMTICAVGIKAQTAAYPGLDGNPTEIPVLDPEYYPKTPLLNRNVSCNYFNGILTVCFSKEEGTADISIINCDTGNVISESFDSAEVFIMDIGCEEGSYEIKIETSIRKRYLGYFSIILPSQSSM